MPAGSRLTITTIGDDPREAAIAAAAAANHLDLPGPVTVSDIAFVEGDLDDDQRDAPRRLPRRPAAADGDVGRTRRRTTTPSRSPCTRGSPMPPPTPSSRPRPSSTCRSRRRRPAGASSSRRAATRRPIDALLRRVIANPVIERWAAHDIEPVFHPGSDDTPPAAVVPIRTLDGAGLAAAQRRTIAGPRSRGARRDPRALLRTRARPDRRRAGDARPDVERALRPQDVPGGDHRRRRRDHSPAPPAPRHHRADRRQVRPLGVRRQRRDRLVRRGRDAGPEGRDAQPPVGRRAVRRCQHRGRRCDPRRPRRRSPADRRHRRACASVPPTSPPSRCPTVPCTRSASAKASSPASPTTATRSACRRSPEPCSTTTSSPPTRSSSAAASARAADREPPTGPHVGDRIILLGGATGRDGIRGATFSSAAMDATTGEVAGASVQIGDPITEKLLIDVLDGAEHLWTAITDCGAGGLSSAIGEMAEGIGADVELDAVPLKYPGLQPWEIWLSEAQERMVLAVAPDDVDELLRRCETHRVDARRPRRVHRNRPPRRALRRRHGARPADRVPPRRTTAATDDRRRRRSRRPPPPAEPSTIRRRRCSPCSPTRTSPPRRPSSIATTTRSAARRSCDRSPARTTQGHADGVVLAHPEEDHGIAVGIGVNPWYGLHDPEAMAAVAVDEAIRNVVAVGADPDRVALLDNFSWGDPRDPETLGTLVAAVAGCCTAAETVRRPVRVRQGLAQQHVHRPRRPATLRAADARHHRRRRRPRRRPLRDPRAHRTRQRAPPRRRHRRALRRQPSRSAHRRPPHAVGGIGHRPAARPGVAGQVPRPAPGDPRRARGSLPRRQRGWSRRRPRRDVHRLPTGCCRSTPCRTPTSPPPCSPSPPDASSSRSPPPTSTRSRRSSDRSTQLGTVTAEPVLRVAGVFDARRRRADRRVQPGATGDRADGDRRRRARARTATATSRSPSSSPAPPRRSSSSTS